MEATSASTISPDLLPSAGAHVLAWLVDALIIALLGVSSVLLVASQPPRAQLANVAGLAAVVLIVGYFVLGVGGRHGATLGGRLAGIRVVDEASGGAIGYQRAALRELAITLSGLWLHLDAVAHLFNRQKRPWHDSIAKAIVIRSR